MQQQNITNKVFKFDVLSCSKRTGKFAFVTIFFFHINMPKLEDDIDVIYVYMIIW